MIRIIYWQYQLNLLSSRATLSYSPGLRGILPLKRISFQNIIHHFHIWRSVERLKIFGLAHDHNGSEYYLRRNINIWFGFELTYFGDNLGCPWSSIPLHRCAMRTTYKVSFHFALLSQTPCTVISLVQRPKKSQLSGRKTFTRKNFANKVHKSSTETVQTVRHISRLSGNFPYCAEIF